jgi:hypothetical protein
MFMVTPFFRHGTRHNGLRIDSRLHTQFTLAYLLSSRVRPKRFSAVYCGTVLFIDSYTARRVTPGKLARVL